MAVATERVKRPTARKIPDALIYEIMDGKPIYRKGYWDVLAGKKTTEEIKGSSSLQALLVSYLNGVIWKFIDEDRYFVLTGEPGVHINHRDNLSHDIAIYDQTVLTPGKISRKYADVPAKVALEVDIEADVSETTETGYIRRKTRKLLDFGTEKVVWVLTEAQVVLIATSERIELLDWNQDVVLLEGITCNIGAYLTRKAVVPD
jgi:hypothetical protein